MNEHTPFVDYGGGYGMFVRLMHDLVVNFYWYDKYCENLFANGFEANEKKYRALTAFELFEHLPEPYDDIEKMLHFSNNIIFSTELIPENISSIKDRSYFSTTTGQHISFIPKNHCKLSQLSMN